MTVATTNSFNLFSGDGITTSFTCSFILPSGSSGADLYLWVISPTGTGGALVQTPITGLGNYTVTINNQIPTIIYPATEGIAPLNPGNVALPAGWQLYIGRIETIQQALNLLTQSVIPSAQVMAALDLLTLICQQLNDSLARCFQLPVGQTLNSYLASAFISAVNNGVLTSPPIGTYAYLKGIAAANPTQWTFGIANDQGVAGEDSLYYYCGNTTVGDNGWFLVSG